MSNNYFKLNELNLGACRIAKKPILLQDIKIEEYSSHYKIIYGEKFNILNKFFLSLSNLPIFVLNIVDDYVYVLPNSNLEINVKKRLFGKKILKIIKSMYGTFRQELNNIIIGLKNLFSAKLKLQGIGYSLNYIKETNILEIEAGFSVPLNEFKKRVVKYKCKSNLYYNVENKNLLIVSGVDKQNVNNEIDVIYRIRKHDNYKGHGFVNLQKPLILKTRKRK